MTENHETANQAADAPAEPHETVKEESTTEPADRAGNEAAKYRRRLRDTEAERDNLTAQRDQLAKQVVEAALLEGLTPEMFWKLSNKSTADYMTEQGTVDLEAVREACTELKSDLAGLLFTGPVIPGQEKHPAKVHSHDEVTRAFMPANKR